MILIATDLDRTLLPNGEQENDQTMDLFYEKIQEIEGVVLVYVTGRNHKLFLEAKEEFGIKDPDFLLGSVGTEIFYQKDGEMEVYPNWLEYLQNNHPNWDYEKIISDVKTDDNLYLQEDEFQNPFKISFYLKDIENKDGIVSEIEEYLTSNSINAEVVYSFDPLKKIGLIDVLPAKATKKGALEFLISELELTKDEVIFAGDSGNDLSVFDSGMRSILVKNSNAETKEKALEIAREYDIEDKLYIASGTEDLNGNYSSGILEGLKHFGVIE